MTFFEAKVSIIWKNIWLWIWVIAQIIPNHSFWKVCMY
jgi:hypothetical protein